MASVPTQSESQICKPKRRTKKQQQNRVKMITGYIIYASEIRREIIRKNPDKDFGGISKIVGAEWKNLPQETKVTYEKRAQEQNDLSKLEFANEPLNKLADVAAARAAANEELQANDTNNNNISVDSNIVSGPHSNATSTTTSTQPPTPVASSPDGNNNNHSPDENNNNNSHCGEEETTNDGSSSCAVLHPSHALQHFHVAQHAQFQMGHSNNNNNNHRVATPTGVVSAAAAYSSPNAQPYCPSIAQHHCCYICCYNGGNVW